MKENQPIHVSIRFMALELTASGWLELTLCFLKHFSKTRYFLLSIKIKAKDN